jgi:hypothetical protein
MVMSKVLSKKRERYETTEFHHRGHRGEGTEFLLTY